MFVRPSEAWLAGSEAWLALKPDWRALRAGWQALRPAWLALRPDWLGLRLAWLALRPSRGGHTDGRKYVCMCVRMENLPILQDFVPYWGRCPKIEF